MPDPQPPEPAAPVAAQPTSASAAFAMPFRPLWVCVGIVMLIWFVRLIPQQMDMLMTHGEHGAFHLASSVILVVLSLGTEACLIFTFFWGGLRSLVVTGVCGILLILGMVCSIVFAPTQPPLPSPYHTERAVDALDD